LQVNGTWEEKDRSLRIMDLISMLEVIIGEVPREVIFRRTIIPR